MNLARALREKMAIRNGKGKHRGKRECNGEGSEVTVSPPSPALPPPPQGGGTRKDEGPAVPHGLNCSPGGMAH